MGSSGVALHAMESRKQVEAFTQAGTGSQLYDNSDRYISS